MLKLVLYSLLLMTNTFALTSEEFFKPIDLEKIEKFTPDNKEVLKYGGDHKGFVDEDGDLADDRLEVYFDKNKASEYIRIYFYRKLHLSLMLNKKCNSKKQNDRCRLLAASVIFNNKRCKQVENVGTELMSFVSSILIKKDYSYDGDMGTKLSRWYENENENKKLIDVFYDCKE